MTKRFLQGVRARRVHLSVLALAFAAVAMAGEPSAESPWQRWSSIRLKVKAMPLLSGRIWMHLRRGEKQIVFETESTAKFLGAKVAKSETRSVIDAESGLPRLHVSRGGKRVRRYIFDETGYTYEKLKAAGDVDAPLDAWEVQRRERFAYPLDEEGRPLPVYDYYGMLLRLRHARLHKVGDEEIFRVATSHGAVAYRVSVAELRADTVSWSTLPGGHEVADVVRQMRLRVVPADESDEKEGFLNMEGETELWVEAESKTVLRIGGKAPKVPGKIALVLAEMG